MANNNNINEVCVCGNQKSPNAIGCHACVQALLHDIASRLTTSWGQPAIDLGKRSLEEVILTYASIFKEMGSESVGTCCICGGRYVFGGCNPYPVVDDESARCCTLCDDRIVQPTRLEKMQEALRTHKRQKI